MKPESKPLCRSALLVTAALAMTTAAQAGIYTWDGTNGENWGAAHWTGAGSTWVDSSSNDAVINGGTVFAGGNGGSGGPGSITANTITVSDATLRPSSNNVFRNNVSTLTLNAGGRLVGGWNATNHISSVIVLNGGDIGGNDNGGDASTYGIYNLENAIHVTANSTISVTGAGATLGQTGGTQFNVDSGNILSVTGTLVHNVYQADTGLIKTGAGTLVLSAANTYTGGTTVNSGVLELSGASGGTGRIRGALAVNPGAELRFTNDDGTGFGWNDARISSLTINGGVVASAGTVHIWNIGGGVTLTGGSLSSNGGVSSATGPQIEWGNTTLTSNASADTATVAGRIHIRRDAASLLRVNVADGAAATDLLISAALTESASGCGLVKSGAGTLKLSGAVNLTGLITVNDGTLDLSSATPGTGLRINVLSGARFIPPASGLPATAALYINGEKISPGTWGAPGSVAAGLAQYESPVLAGSTVVTVPDTGISNRERFKTLKYGVFSHYNYWSSGTGDVNDAANAFNAEQYASDLVTAGVQYVVWTAWHGNMFPMFPSQAAAKYGYGDRCSTRDTVSDMIDAVKARGIRVFLYTHPYQPLTYDLAHHNNFINELYAETVDRYGSRIDGLWIDENQINSDQDSLVDYKRLMATIKEHNPDLVTMQNGWQLYTADTGGNESVGYWNFGQSQPLYCLVSGQGVSPEDMLRTTVLQAAANFDGGGIHLSIDGVAYAGLAETTRIFQVGSYLAPIRASVCETKPSTSFPPPYNGNTISYDAVNWVATTSTDETKEFIHVLKAPAGNTLTLPGTADGKVFGSATLMASLQAGGATQQYLGTPVAMIQTPRGIQLTLPSGASWSSLDTVIQLDVASKGGAGMVNNTSTSISYTGSSWIYQNHRGAGEYNDDAHTATANGDSFTFTFSGTDVEYIATRGTGRGPVDIYIDEVFQTTVDLSAGTPVGSRQTVFRKSGLARGTHTLRAVKTGGTLMELDALKVTELINDSDADLAASFPSTVFYGAGSAIRPYGSRWELGNGGWMTPQTGSYPAPNPSDGDYFDFTFTGTAVQAYLSAAWGSGNYVMYVDGVYHGTINVGGPVTYSVTGLANGPHTLRGVTATTNPYGFIASFSGFTVARPGLWSYQAGRGYGEIGDDVHYTDINPAGFSYNFNGSGVDVITTRDSDARIAYFSVSGMGNWVGSRYNNYSPTRQTGTSVFQRPNLAPGSYSVSVSHCANTSGLNFSFARLAIDALRVYKAESLSAAPLYWGASGNGGSGTWDIGGTANWFDGGASTGWHDFGGNDYTAVFSGTAGTVNLASNVNANRLTFKTAGYTLQGGSLTLTGSAPTLISDANATIASTLNGSSGLTKSGMGTLSITGPNTYTGATSIAAGALALNGSYATPSFAIASGAVLDFNAATSLNLPTVTISGTGTLRKTGSSTLIWGSSSAVFALGTGSLIDVQGGTFVGGSYANENWTANLSDLHVASGASFNTVEANVRVNRLTGSGTIGTGYSGAGYQNLSVGVDNGSATFEGGITNTDNNPSFIGNLVKLGTGTQTLAGSNTYTGSTTIEAGKLILSGSLDNTSSVTIATGATLEISGSLAATGNIVNHGTLILTGAPQMSAGGTITNHGTIINRSKTYTLPADLVNNGSIFNVPAAPVGLTATPGDAQVALSWNAVSGATGYTVKQSAFSGGPYTVIATPATSSYSVSGLANGSAYYFVVSATNATGEGADSAQVSATPAGLPLPRVTADIGSVGLTGSATWNAGTFTILGAGNGVYASSDAFRYVYQNSSGDCDIRIRVQSLTNPSVSAKAGVMIRESLASNSRCAGVYVTPTSGIQFIWRGTIGSMVSIAAKTGLTAPYWVRLNRSGNTFRAYYSANGSTWTQLSNGKSITMASAAYIGTPVTSGTTSALCTAVFTNELTVP